MFHLIMMTLMMQRGSSHVVPSWPSSSGKGINSTANNQIYGDSKPFTVDSDNVICDGNHRMNKLLEEKGPDHEVEVLKYKFPQWCALLSLGIHGFSNWTKLKWKATLKEFKEYNREQTK